MTMLPFDHARRRQTLAVPRVLVRLATFLALILSLFAPPAAAQGGAASAAEGAADTAVLERLIVTLESETGRGELIEQLEALLEARRKAQGEAATTDGRAAVPLIDGGAAFGALADRARRIGAQFVASAQIVSDIPKLIGLMRSQFADPARRAGWLDAILKIAAAIVAAAVVEMFVAWLLSRPRNALETRAGDGWAARALLLVARALLELVPIALFAVAAQFALSLLDAREATVAAAKALVLANVMARGVLVVARLFLAPQVERLRILPLGGETANYAYLWIRRFANVGLYGAFTIEAAAILGMPAATAAVLQQALGLLLVGMAIALILQLRDDVRKWIAGSGETAAAGLRARIADIWHVVAILYVVILFGVWLLDVSNGFFLVARATGVTLFAVTGAWLVGRGLNRMLRAVFAVGAETAARFPGLEDRAGRYLRIVHTLARAAVWFVAATIVAEAWGLDAFVWLGSPTGRTIFGVVAQIVVVTVLAIVALELSNSAIERYLRRSQDEGAATARMLTLLPLLRNILRVAIATVAVLIVLSELGINIGPLLAGAGVAGLAIGFGSQKLVQDVINGMFIIIEDTVAVGDVVSVAGHTGLCEALTIRTITLRDLSGTVHTVPFSDVTSIQNLTKDFSFAVMDVGVAYREDTDEVIEILRLVDDELRGEPEYGAVMLEPLEVLGVDEFADSAVVIKVRIKTRPIKQWTVKREFNRRMKKAFDAHGIEIPFPHTTLYFGEDKQGSAPPAQVVLTERYGKSVSADPSPNSDAGPLADRLSDERTGSDLPE